jgi:tRNA A-37 threonylcarbamoyl transferase component Bud32
MTDTRNSQPGQHRLLTPPAKKLPPIPGPSASVTSLPAHTLAVTLVANDLPAELARSGKYEIRRKLGQGGMGVVYKARHTLLGEKVAIKLMTAEVLDNPEARHRFLREMQAVGQLKHKNIVRALDAEQVGDRLLLVMEYVSGITLDELVKQKGALRVDFACDCIAQAAEGLQYAHDKGMIHRDVKPANLMVTRREHEVKLLDFGLARGPRQQTKPGSYTQAQMFMGTPEYVAPEQATDACSADGRADVYSLGCTLYFLLGGRPPFQADTPMETVVAQIQDEARPLTALRPDVPDELWQVVARMLAKKPAQRYQTPAEVARALQPFLAGGKGAMGADSLVPGEQGAGGQRTEVANRGARTPPVQPAAEPADAEEPEPAPPRQTRPAPRQHRARAKRRWLFWAVGLAAVAMAFLALLILLGRLVLWTDRSTKQGEDTPIHDSLPEPVLVKGGPGIPASSSPPSNPSPNKVVLADAEKWLREANDLYGGQGGKVDRTAAARLYQKAADQGHPLAQGFLGLLHARGQGVTQDRAKAEQLCRGAIDSITKEATNGLVVAQQLLGQLYLEGLGVGKDDKEALRWFERAAAQGLAAAQYHLGLMYESGLAGETNPREARRQYELAADQGFAEAELALGLKYLSGLGGTQNDREALKWVGKAARKDLLEAQFHLGWIYHHRKSVRNDVESVRWYRLAAE